MRSRSAAAAPALPALRSAAWRQPGLTFQVSLAGDQRAAANAPHPAASRLLKLVFKTTALCRDANVREQAGG